MSEKFSQKAPECKIEKWIKFSEKELNTIANEIFKPESGYVNEAVRFYTGQQKLEGYQRILLGPANAFESLITFGVNLLNGKAKKDVYALTKNISDKNTRTLLSQTIKKGWKNCTKTEKTAFISEFIYAILIGGGSISKFKKIIPAKKFAALQTSATAQKLQTLATAVVASPADDFVAALAPAIEQTANIQTTGLHE